MRRLRLDSPSPRLLGTVALLGLALVVASGLAYQAWRAARSQQTTADHTLRDYAAFADWQLAQQARGTLLQRVLRTLGPQASRLDPRRPRETRLSPEQVREVALAGAGDCGCLSGVRYYFRYDWNERALRTTPTDWSDADLAWARDTMFEYVSSLPIERGARALALDSSGARPGDGNRVAATLTNDSYALLSGQRHGEGFLLVFVTARDPANGKPLALYGYATESRAFLGPTFDEIRRHNALLPASLVADLTPDSILSIQVQSEHGNEVYRSPGYFSKQFSAVDTLDKQFGSLIVRVALRPEIASQLIVGGLPTSRVPLLIGLWLLTAALLAVSVVQLRRQQELARLRSEFVSGVSHELRTPLAQIRWFAELLHRGRLRSDEERARSARIIDQEARRLTYLVENVLAFSRGETGALRMTPESVNLASEIDDTVESFAPLARARASTIETDLDADVVAWVNRDALRQVLLNLLDNAVKYGPEGQTITVGAMRAADRARLWVDDEGPGIPERDRARVWDAYVRLASPSPVAGSGIGLSVVHELVTSHGGRTLVESAPTGGARFIVELPLAAFDEAPAGPSHAAAG